MFNGKIKVDILLSTYNGEKYLSELFCSLENQTHTNWHLYIRDDGSTDKTISIINEFSKKHLKKVSLTKGKNIGVIKSFNELLKNSKSDYVLFCDQDDIWLNNKIEVLLKTIIQLETDNKAPALVFSDMIVVNKNLEIICKSFWKFHCINPQHIHLNRLLLQNVVTGCASILNRSLVRKLNTFPDNIIMHDWWIALVASTIGKIDFINKQTLKYRMHDKNQIGAKSVNFKRISKENFKSISKRVNEIYDNTYKQAENLLDINININHKEIIYDYLSLKKINLFKRHLIFFKRKFYFSSFIRTLIFIIFLKRKK